MYQSGFARKRFNRCLSLVVLITMSFGAVLTNAQTKRGVRGTGKPVVTPVAGNQAAKCNGGWSGVITYTVNRDYEWDSGVQKQIPHGTQRKKTTEEYKYTGRVVVDASQNPRSPTARGQVTFTHNRTEHTRQDQRDTCFYDGIDGSVHQWTEVFETDKSHAYGEGDVGFNLRVDELRAEYSFNFRFDEVNGTQDKTYDKKAGGWCNAEFNKPETKTWKYTMNERVHGAEIEDQRFDPLRPDVLSGTKTWVEEASYAKGKKTVYNVTWSFKRCPAPVEVTDIRFDDHRYPDHKTWKEIDMAGGTIDGNLVRIRATITNFSGETKFPNLKFYESVENWVLPDGESSIRLGPGESREVELEWDTAGYAWLGKGYDAESYRKIKVEAEDSGKTSAMQKLIVVKPRPVVLAHGLWSNAAAWAGYDKYFEEGHSKAWKSYAVGADPGVAKMNTGDSFGSTAPTNSIHENAGELEKQIEHVRKDQNAWHVDIVAHSMGGLISRSYINERMPANPLGRRPVVTRLVMLGTPNAGSPCAELMYRALALTGTKVTALHELRPSVVELFNDRTTRHRGTRFSALVGWRIPNTCQSPAQGDGVVTVGSARFKVKDWKYSNSLAHTDLTSRADFGGFVFPRLSIGPRGNQDPDLVEMSENHRDEQYDETVVRSADRYGFNSMFRKASYRQDAANADDTNLDGMTTAKQVKLAAGQSTEVEIPMTAGSRASIVFAAPANVSVTLTDAAGAIVGKNLAGTPESKQMFRTISVERPVTAGTWKLKLESRETGESSVILAAFADPNPLALELTVGKPSATKQVQLQAKLSLNGRPAGSAAVTAKLQAADGRTLDLTLLDDGARGDGIAGDGIYGASTEKLADGDYMIEAAGSINGQTRNAFATVTVGAPAPAKAPAAGPAKK